MGHVVGEIHSEVGFGCHFSHFWPQNKPILTVFLKKTLREDLHIPVYGWKLPILQSGALQIKQNLMSKIKPKLTTKMQLIDL